VDTHGERATALVRGPIYDQPGHWQQLVLKHVPKRLAAEVRALRTVPGAKVDPREAFVDGVVLIVPGDPQGVEVVTDELDVDGVNIATDGVQVASFPAPADVPAQAPLVTPSVRAELAAVDVQKQMTSRLQGSLLMVDGKPFTPRAIQWHGEPLQFLANCGFNTVQLPSEPTADQSAEAHRLGVWFLCAPPRPDEIRQRGLGLLSDRVIAWYLDDEAFNGDRQYARIWADLIRQRDAVAGRPVIMALGSEGSSAGKIADIVVAKHPRAAQLPFAEYSQWLTAALASKETETPFFAFVPTQWGESTRGQAAALTGSAVEEVVVDGRQLESLVEAAFAHGSSGFIFTSQTRLDGGSNAARSRAAQLELINRRLQLVEPWLAAGNVVGRVNSLDSTYTGVILHVDHARLLVPLKTEVFGSSSRSSPKPNLPRNDLVFVVPGIPESSRAFSLSAVELRSLACQRVAGGTRIVVPAADYDSLVLLTEDPAVIHSFRQRVARDGPRVARLQSELARGQLSAAEEIEQRLAKIGLSNQLEGRRIATLASQLRDAEARLLSGRTELAYRIAASVIQSLAHMADERQKAVGPAAMLVSHPFALNVYQQAEHAEFSQRLASLRGGENLLYGGDFEDLGQMTQFGWQHVRHESRGVEAGATLSPDNPQHGIYCLELFAAAAADERPGANGNPAVWVESPPIPVDSGSIVEIRGWVRIDEAIIGSVDGLEIMDSLGGAELSLAVRKTNGWQPFQIIRGVPESRELRVTFALSGVGSASLDGVMVRTLQSSAARRLPPLSPMDRSATNDSEATGPLFVAPATR
jgi:hypothetical protein